MDKESAKAIYGLVGYPVRHSLSPLMHNAAFGALTINAEYKLFEIEPEKLKDFFASIKGNNILGLNVTIPYKEKVISFLDNLSEEARLIGAVNTIKVSANKLAGFNTDAEGFLRHLVGDLDFNPKDKNIAILGAGGAAKAISVALAKTRPKKISLYDIDTDKLSALIEQLKRNFNDIEFKIVNSIAGLDIEGADLLVNATPIGMKEDDPCLVEERFIHKGILVYDLIYNPQETKLLKIAKEKGCRISNGLGMLLYQGARSFEIWTDQKAPLKIMREALEEGVKKI